MDTFDILGQQIVGEMLGADDKKGGFDPSFLVSAASELAKGGIAEKQKADAAKKSSLDDEANSKKAIAADAAWADAEAQLDLVAQGGTGVAFDSSGRLKPSSGSAVDPTRLAAAQTLASSAQQAAVAAGAVLSTDAQAKRVAADRDAAGTAAKAALANPKDGLSAAKMRAWQKVSIMASTGGAGATPAFNPALASQMAAQAPSGSFLTRKLGPLPVWGWGAAAGVLVGGFFVVRKLLRR